MPMTATVTASEFSRNIAMYQKTAAIEPVVVTNDGQPTTVLIAYDDFLRLSKRDRRAELTCDLGAAEIAAIAASEMEPGQEYLDAERHSHDPE
jgi:prevent-host-death family protein